MLTFNEQVQAHEHLGRERTQEWLSEELEKVREKIASSSNPAVVAYLRKREGYLMAALNVKE